MKIKLTTLTDIEREELFDRDVTYCTQCGASLDEFFLSDDCIDIAKLKANYEKCKRIGRFKGDICAKLFIAASNLDGSEF